MGYVGMWEDLGAQTGPGNLLCTLRDVRGGGVTESVAAKQFSGSKT